MALIRSGSLSPGVNPDRFGLPAGTALRYERPADALSGMLLSYAVLDSDPAVFKGPHSWMLPTWAQIWIVLAQGPITVKIGPRHYDPLSSAILYGPTSRAMPATSKGGVSIAIDVSPLGWARFFAPSAEGLRDRITPLGDLLPAEQVAELAVALDGSDRDTEVKAIIDAFFLRHLPPPHPDEPMISAIMALLADEDTTDLADAAPRLGIGPSVLTRLAKRHFGFPPKMLTIRARFLRALTAMLTTTDPVDFSAVPPGYYSVPHFIRDANQILGMTPRRFLLMEMPYLRAALRARTMVLGTATPGLDRPPATGDGDPGHGRATALLEDAASG